MSRDTRRGRGDDGGPDTAVGADPSVAIGGDRVELTDLTKQYDGETAVDGVDLTVEPGELLVLLGPSGCGKTTTLRLIAGLEDVTEGSVTIGGREVSRTTPQNRDVAMVFQNYALYPHKTVRGNIRFPLRKMNLGEEELTERVESTARLLGIDDLLEKQPAALSGGQRQRVAVGRAIARRPSVLLMDEPLSNLDAKLSVRTRSELRDLQQRLGITTVYVTHDQEEAMSIADRIAVMNDGGIAQVGTPEAVYREPDSAFIAEFLGDPSMNLFEADGTGPVVDALADGAPGAAVRVGIRPEDASFIGTEGDVHGDAPAETTATVDCEVVVVEPIGRAYEVTLVAGDDRFIARTRSVPEHVRDGSQTRVTFDRRSVTFFDADGRRIPRG